MVETINPTHLSILKLLKIKRGISREELFSLLRDNSDLTDDSLRNSIKKAVRELEGFIKRTPDRSSVGRPTELITITEAGQVALHAFKLANGK